MNKNILEICNNNTKNCPSDQIYQHFNNFIFSNDIKLMGKLLHRFNFFNMTKDLPGDIIEIGVFKGSGIATFTKFIEIFCPHSNKKVIGFDIFDSDNKDEILNKDGDFDKQKMNLVYSKVVSEELTLKAVESRLNEMNVKNKFQLEKGDVEFILPPFLKNNPGLRVCLIYIDVDLERPTYHSLKNLWDRLLPGGIIVFDEYEYHKFSESNGVDKFLKEFNIEYTLKSTNFMAPTSFLIKK